VPDLADWCTIDLIEEDGSIRRLAVAAADAMKEELARELQRRYPPGPDRPYTLLKVLRSGRSELIEELSEVDVDARARDREHLRLLRGLGIRSLIVVPLRVRGRTVGTITLVLAGQERRYRTDDLEVVEELAYRCAMAIDASWLYRKAQQARALAEAAERRSAFLAEASNALASSLDYQTTLANVARLAVPAFADRFLVQLPAACADAAVSGPERLHVD
jgi:GAF domain-containing protein